MQQLRPLMHSLCSCAKPSAVRPKCTRRLHADMSTPVLARCCAVRPENGTLHQTHHNPWTPSAHLTKLETTQKRLSEIGDALFLLLFLERGVGDISRVVTSEAVGRNVYICTVPTAQHAQSTREQCLAANRFRLSARTQQWRGHQQRETHDNHFGEWRRKLWTSSPRP